MTRDRHAVPASILYSPARDANKMNEARKADADLWLVDLEDSVPPALRPEARAAVTRYLSAAAELSRTAVRINPMSSADYCADILMLLAQVARPRFVFMTMVDDPSEVRCLRAALGAAGWFPLIYATIETPKGLANVRALAAELDGMILGSADLAAAMEVEISSFSLRAAREAMALAAAESGAGCIDTGNFRLDDTAALDEEIAEARALGFHGKGTVHPKELPAINGAFRPNHEDTEQARRVQEAYTAAGGGVCMLDGRMIGPPFARLAEARLRRAEAWQRAFGGGDDS